MRVLLVSPVDPKVPSNLKYLMGGESTYTRTLIEKPPKGVEYIYYLDALGKGEIEFGQYQKLLHLLVKFRILPLSAGTMDLIINGKFDLIHCHAYTLCLTGRKARKIPVVMGDSIPTKWSLNNYFRQGWLRIEANYMLRSVVHRMLRIYDQDLMLGDFRKLVVMSEFAKKEHIKIGADVKRIEVVYPGLVDRGVRKPVKGKVRILFAGVWFRRKGGEILLRAYQNIRKRYKKNVELTVLGPVPDDVREKGLINGVKQRDYVKYSELVGEVYANTDVLIHVPAKAEGYGLVVQEAMSFGIPAIVSKVGALPEMVVNGKTGLVINPGDVRALEDAMAKLVEDDGFRENLGKNTRQRFLDKFHISVMQKRLMKVYKEAIG